MSARYRTPPCRRPSATLPAGGDEHAADLPPRVSAAISATKGAPTARGTSSRTAREGRRGAQEPASTPRSGPSRGYTGALTGSRGRVARGWWDLPRVRDLAELRELVALRDQRGGAHRPRHRPQPRQCPRRRRPPVLRAPRTARRPLLRPDPPAAARAVGRADLPAGRCASLDQPLGGIAVTGVMRRGQSTRRWPAWRRCGDLVDAAPVNDPRSVVHGVSTSKGHGNHLSDVPLRSARRFSRARRRAASVDQGGALTDLGEKEIAREDRRA